MSYSGTSGLSSLRVPRVLDDTHEPEGLWWFDGDLTDQAGSDDLSVDLGTIQYTSSHEHGRLAVRFRDNQLRLIGSNPAPANLRVQGDVTVEIVCMFDTTVGVDSFGTDLFGCANSGSLSDAAHNDLYMLYLDNQAGQMVPGFYWEYGSGSFAICTSDTRLALGQWYHIVGVRESEGGGLSTARLYLNGVLIKEVTGLADAVDGSSGRITSGRDLNNSGQGWLGGILSSAKVIDRALSAREVLGEYQYVSGERESPSIAAEGVKVTVPPLAYWKFDGDVTDEGGNYDFQNDIGTGPPAFTTGFLPGTQALDTTSAARGIERTTHDSALALAGEAMTVELMFNRVSSNGSSSEPFLLFFGSGESEAANYTWFVGITNGTPGSFGSGEYLAYIGETGAGTNIGLASTAQETEIEVGSGWRHIAMTRDADGFVKLFLDGVKVLEGATTPTTGGTSAYLRLGDTTGASFAQGYFQEVKLYDYEWEEAQVAHRAWEVGIALPTPLAYWKLNGGMSDEYNRYPMTHYVGAASPVYTTGYLAGTQALDTTSAARGIERRVSDPELRLLGRAMSCELLFNRQASVAAVEPLAVFNGALGDTSEATNYTWAFALTNGTPGDWSSGDYLAYTSEYGVGINEGVTNTSSANDVLVSSGWHHLAFTRSESGYVKLFIDGVKTAEGSTTMPSGGTESFMRIGDNADNSYVEGYIQEVRVYDAELTENQIINRAHRLGF